VERFDEIAAPALVIVGECDLPAVSGFFACARDRHLRRTLNAAAWASAVSNLEDPGGVENNSNVLGFGKELTCGRRERGHVLCKRVAGPTAAASSRYGRRYL
jgi:hypothetical protein